MSKLRIISFLFLLFFLDVFGQQEYSISGTVVTNDGEPLAFANILVLRSKDSTLVEGSIAGDDGKFKLSGIPSENYLVMASMVGFEPGYSPEFNLTTDITIETLVLTEEELEEVQLEGRKPLYQQKMDRMIINVENSIVSAGSTALEILERSPGVLVNRQNNTISIVGKEGVVVMINDKISYLPVSTLVQMLDGMSSDNIVSIELITTPPANLDAEGNAGYINIILKKSTDEGLNGSFSVAAGYSNAFVTNNSINLNYRKGKFNLFGNYSFSMDGTDQVIQLSREYTEKGDRVRNYTFSERDPDRTVYNMRTGVDYELSENTIIGILVNGYSNRWTMEARNENTFFRNGEPESYLNLINDEINHWEHLGANFNISHEFSEEGKLDLNVDYLYYKDDNPNDYLNSYFDENQVFLADTLTRSTKLTPIHTFVGALDYTNKLNEDLKLETGLKFINNNFENDVAVEYLINDIWIPDPSLTNKSNLDEQIYAAYISAEYNFTEKTGAKLGFRYEYTNSQLDTDKQGRVVDRQYGRLFPTIYLNHSFNDSLSMNLSYSRRITRPTFNDLAPFVILFDPNTFFSGNASLQPSISNAVRYSINYKSAVLSLEYTNEDSSIANFQERLDEETGRLIFEASNLDYTRTFGISLGFPWRIFNWWRMQNNFNYVRQQVRGFYYEEPIQLSLGNFSCNISNSFEFAETWSAELSGFYVSEGFFGTAKYDAFYRIDAGISKKFGEEGGSLKFSVRDILDSFEFTGGTNIPEQDLQTSNLFDFSAPTFLLTYSRSFGNQKLKSSRDRKTGAEIERQRVSEQ
ncbi:outer membrane beta-barrel family protein [Christiangramia aestuarii]|uniref:Outer membrane beta-barrel protein n=1 Tax=Christiangramia aestuarii TaxID=1028746 RepID=A0A7K1LQA3_9FLAO|nr:outer membrane beta-barrel family protein [Christiangramia aestuarii]MUP42801.1 outer membrane beta-barrel protein [Christiangramia aestuarii]